MSVGTLLQEHYEEFLIFFAVVKSRRIRVIQQFVPNYFRWLGKDKPTHVHFIETVVN